MSEACAVPATQQALRRGLGKAVDEVPARTHAALLRNGLVPDGLPPVARWAHYAVAALIAARPRGERVAGEEARSTQFTAAEGPSPAAPPEGVALPQHPVGSATTADPSRVAGPGGPGLPSALTEQRPSWGTSLGSCLAQALIRTKPDSIKADSDKVSGPEARLHLLVRQDLDGLHRMLPGVLRQLGSAGVPADYGRLLHDIANWPYQRGETATRWLEDYYRTLRRAEPRD
ncbi:type I-E CRISPR-associated protein Cse2/CasB [Streptomyces cyaneofuscatus]|uniref:type I-E CRISPR-associated protein Cse2/CasB n=1 Tax=Streptomyces cyaneofuscatus TaxID=66883 RepID=UPI0033D01546